MTASPLMMLFAALALAQPEPAPSPAAAAAAAAAAAEASSAAAATSALSDPLSIEDSLQLRDPFRKPIKYADPNNNLALPELERYGIDQIKVVGIITGPKKPKALVTTPSNKMLIIQENDKIGIHKGYVKKIKEKSIVVRERVVNLLGQEENTDSEIFYLGGESKGSEAAKAGDASAPPPGQNQMQQVPDTRRL